MNTKDEYTVEIMNGFLYRYFKNGKLHREAGPATFSTQNKQYINLGDEHLYIVKIISNNSAADTFQGLYQHLMTTEVKGSSANSTMTTVLKSFNELMTSYHLDGVRYDKNEFDILILKRNLSNELIDNNQETKPKIKL
jgi:hypothetical protein